MRKLPMIILGLLFIGILMGCATTYYIPTQCPQMEVPPNLHDVSWVMIIITDPTTDREIVYYAIPASEAIKEKLNVERIKEYAIRAYELNKTE